MDAASGRERVLAALSHQEGDRIPLDLGAHGSTGIHKVAYRALRAHLGLPEAEVRVWHHMQQRANPDDDILELCGADARRLGRGDPSGWSLKEERNNGTVSYLDEFGIRFCRSADGLYFDPREHPLAACQNARDVDRYPWPDATDPARYEGIVERGCDLCRRGGGFVFTPVQNIQADVPPQNIVTMWEAFHEYAAYR